ncbi:MAG: CobD/CbiB family protein [Betaproteobacteria bacterium]|jgi:cobalamin biosynthesis protein CobD/CbiB|nr:CobD/CbiB family protein [Betaproteobacteria bacterium]
MNFLALLLALALEQLHSTPLRGVLHRGFVRYANLLERELNAGETRHGLIALLAAVLPPALLAFAIFWVLASLNPLLGLAWNALVLYLSLGLRQFSHPFTAIAEALRAGDVNEARRLLAEWRGGRGLELSSSEIARLSIEQGLLESHRHVFGTIAWYLVLPGPSGAVLYRCLAILAQKWSGDASTPMGQELAEFGRPARRFFALIDWLPVRLTAMSYAIVGDFEDAVYCWRTQAAAWTLPEQGIVLAAGAGAIGVRLGEPLREVGGGLIYRPDLGVGDAADSDLMQSAVGLIWRALAVWMVLILLATLAYWVG